MPIANIPLWLSRGNRVYRHRYVPSEEKTAEPRAGHPTWYGERFSLAEPESWSEPDETFTIQQTSRRGKEYKIERQAWHDMLMPGKNKPNKLPMHEHPFTLVRIIRDDKDGTPAFKRPLWLIVMGNRRHELSLEQIYEAYSTRFDIEHFFRVGKRKLLMVAFQAPEVEREEMWFQLPPIAYAQLWMARHLAESLPRPWERNLPSVKRAVAPPTFVQRGFDRIIRQFGTPAKPPKLRGIPAGRPQGVPLPKRARQPVVVKSQLAA